jgi:hypothetical protein
MIGARKLSLTLPVCFAFAGLLLVSAGPAAASGRQEYIEAVVKESDYCSSLGGKFDAIQNGRKIDVEFSFISGWNKEALEINNKGKDLEDVKSIVCPPPGEKKLPITGKKLKMEGLWKNWDTFVAYEIYLPD